MLVCDRVDGGEHEGRTAHVEDRTAPAADAASLVFLFRSWSGLDARDIKLLVV